MKEYAKFPTSIWIGGRFEFWKTTLNANDKKNLILLRPKMSEESLLTYPDDIFSWIASNRGSPRQIQGQLIGLQVRD